MTTMVYYGLLLFILFEYVRPGTYLPLLYALHLNTIIPLAVFVGSLTGARPHSLRELLKEPNTKFVLALLSLIFISVLTADVTQYSYTIFKTVLGYLLIMIVVMREVTTLPRIRGVFGVLIAVHLLLVALTPELLLDPSTRHYMASGSFLGDGNDFALSVSIAVPFAVFLLQDMREYRWRMLLGPAAIVLVLCIIGTSSRGGTLALVAVGCYYWLVSRRKVVTALAIFAILLIVKGFAPPEYMKRMSLIQNYEKDGSAQGRLLAWGSGVRMALDRPLLGVGAGHFAVKYGVEYRPPGYGRTEIPWSNAHSIYFLTLGELGFPGLALLLLLFAHNFLANRRLAREVRQREEPDGAHAVNLLRSVNAGMVAFLVGGAFLSAVYYPHLYLLAALNVAARRLAGPTRSPEVPEGEAVVQD